MSRKRLIHCVYQPNGDMEWLFREVDIYGTVRYWLNGKLHREDGPAEEFSNGDKVWLLNGALHREAGPAVEFSDGEKRWYRNGKLHREDGPSIEFPNGVKYWYFNDKPHREDGPAIEFGNGRKEWHYNGERVSCKSQEEFERFLSLKALW